MAAVLPANLVRAFGYLFVSGVIHTPLSTSFSQYHAFICSDSPRSRSHSLAYRSAAARSCSTSTFSAFFPLRR
jgi:hypothetical protein